MEGVPVLVEEDWEMLCFRSVWVGGEWGQGVKTKKYKRQGSWECWSGSNGRDWGGVCVCVCVGSYSKAELCLRNLGPEVRWEGQGEQGQRLTPSAPLASRCPLTAWRVGRYAHPADSLVPPLTHAMFGLLLMGQSFAFVQQEHVTVGAGAK